MWGANNHTVTKSSELTPCNKTSDSPFTSGEQNQGFMFSQVVNDTNPLFFYCGTPTHCQKGMFGIINPPNAAGAATSVSSMMPSIAANSSDVMGYSAIVAKATTGNALAATWGSNIDMGSLPAWSHEFIAENVLYTRSFLAANSEVLQNDGSVNLRCRKQPVDDPPRSLCCPRQRLPRLVDRIFRIYHASSCGRGCELTFEHGCHSFDDSRQQRRSLRSVV
jgi:hypothetical protein